MNKQAEAWATNFGEEYTKRNLLTLEEMEQLHVKYYGYSRTKINEQFFNELNRNIRILEVGCNIGTQLTCLQKMGFVNLYGIEISPFACEIAKAKTMNVNIVRANALDIPFKDNYFDLVFTSGVLIHIGENELYSVMKEIYRCSRRYIFGFEYFSEKRTEINYRGNKDLLWKDNYPKLYTTLFSELKIIRLKLYKYIENDNQDIAYLLTK